MSSTVKGAALEALKRMGFDKLEMPLEVQLHKVLLHEPSGIFEFIHHKANEIGVLANMMIQLPSEGAFEGGALVVSQGKECTTLDFSTRSSNRYFLYCILCRVQVYAGECDHSCSTVPCM
jgi:hypothetical protein